MTAVIEVTALRKEYGRGRRRSVRAVDGLDLEVPEGGVFGFLGPNGSGKTTTIRCILGLARPTGGTCRVLGASVPHELPRVVSRIGALVETPGIHLGMTGRQTLRVLADLAGVSPARADALLEEMGLAGRAGDAVKGYSLGMRQRLGIAIALLRDPQLLILDEPANGLDPSGIREIRRLIRRLGDEGRTIFLSSHLLDEVEQVCDRIAIVSRGRAVTAGSVKEVLRGGATNVTLVRVAKPVLARRALAAAGIESTRDGDVLRVPTPAKGAEAIGRALAARNLFPSELRPEEAHLEDVFLRLTETPADES